MEIRRAFIEAASLAPGCSDAALLPEGRWRLMASSSRLFFQNKAVKTDLQRLLKPSVLALPA